MVRLEGFQKEGMCPPLSEDRNAQCRIVCPYLSEGRGVCKRDRDRGRKIP